MALSKKKTSAIIDDHLIAIAEKGMPQDVRIHLESCERCAFLVQRFVHAWQNIAPSVERVSSPSFLPQLMERIEAYDKLTMHRKNTIFAAWRILRLLAATAVLLAGIFAGYEVGKISMTEVAPEKSVSLLVLDSLESIPRGSVADFYVSYQISEKEETDEK